MSNKRDPRINPRPGDEIMQMPSRCRLRVTSITGDEPHAIVWERYTKRNGWDHENAWTLQGWRNVVAKGSRVVYVAESEG